MDGLEIETGWKRLDADFAIPLFVSDRKSCGRINSTLNRLLGNVPSLVRSDT